MSTYDTKSILQMAKGAFQERVDLEMSKIIDNILDPNTKPTQKRKLTMTIEFVPDDSRSDIAVNVVVKSNLAPTVPARTSLYIAGDGSTGECQVVEMVPQIPGQVSLDGKEQDAPAALKIIKFA